MLRKDTAFAVAATALVIVGLALGFWRLGGRPRQRDLRADAARVNDLRAIAVAIRSEWRAHTRDQDRKLPAALSDIRVRLGSARTSDPISGTSYQYMPKTDSQYELCAVFSTDSSEFPSLGANAQWSHPQGRHCFLLDATTEPPNGVWLP